MGIWCRCGYPGFEGTRTGGLIHITAKSKPSEIFLVQDPNHFQRQQRGEVMIGFLFWMMLRKTSKPRDFKPRF